MSNKEVKKSVSGNENNAGDNFLDTLPSKDFFSLNITLRGNYDGLVEFIDKINSLKYYNVMESLNIASIEVDNDDIKNDNNNGSVTATLVSGSDNIDISDANSDKKEISLLESKITVLFYLKEKQNEE